MIEIVLENPTSEERPSSAPTFMVNSPTLNPFIAPGPVAVVESDDHFDVEWTDERSVKPTQSAVELAEESVARSKREARLHSGSSRARTNLGVALMAADRVPEAIEAFQEALRLDGHHYPALAHLARLRLVQDDLSDAERLATRLRELFPRDAVARMMLGLIALRRKHADLAIQELTAASKLDASSALPIYLLGMVLLGMRRTRDAIAYLRRATRLDDRSPTLQRGLGVAYVSSGNLARAVRALRTSHALDPGAPETVHALARVLMQHGDAQAAVDVLRAFVDRNPRDLISQELLAQGYKGLDEPRAVRRHLQRALESCEGDNSIESNEERARLMNNIGVACASVGSVGDAERWYKKAVDAAPHPIAFRNLFGVYSERQDGAGERRVLNQWLEMFPDDDEAALRLAIQLTEKGEVDRGLKELRRLTESVSVSVRAYAALGYALSDFVRDMKAASAVLEEGYERFPRDAAIANNLAYVYLRSGVASEARRVLEQVDKQELESSVYLIATWGLLSLSEGDVEAARHKYDRAAALAEHKGWKRLAQTVRQKMRVELARHYLDGSDLLLAAAEIEKGLAIRGKKQYGDELREMRSQLRALERQSARRGLNGGAHNG